MGSQRPQPRPATVFLRATIVGALVLLHSLGVISHEVGVFVLGLVVGEAVGGAVWVWRFDRMDCAHLLHYIRAFVAWAENALSHPDVEVGDRALLAADLRDAQAALALFNPIEPPSLSERLRWRRRRRAQIDAVREVRYRLERHQHYEEGQ
jgi:hypothetical protein